MVRRTRSPAAPSAGFANDGGLPAPGEPDRRDGRVASDGAREAVLGAGRRRLWEAPAAWLLLAAASLGYSLVALLLSWADARAMPEPFLRIDADEYFRWGTWFYAPVIAAAWLLASGIVFLLAWAVRRPPDFARVATAMAAATGIGTLGTLLPDLVTSPLRALGVIDERAWERSITEQTGWFWFTWVTLVVYVVLFLVAFPLAVRRSTSLRSWGAVAVGVVAFAVFQGFEFLFIR